MFGRLLRSFFSTIRAPKLSSLKMDSAFFLDDPSLASSHDYWLHTSKELRSAFRTFLSHCAESLWEMSLLTGVDEDVSGSIVSIAANLSYLHVSDTFSPSFFEALTLHCSDNGQDVVSGFCPHLASIDIAAGFPYEQRSESAYRTAVYVALVDMVESKWRAL